MTKNIEVPLDEVQRVYEMLEKLNGFFHQPLNFEEPKATYKWALDHYDTIHDLYYNVVWNWLPEDVRGKYPSVRD